STLKWLSEQPELMKRLTRLREISTSEDKDLDTLAKAERAVIDEVDRLGARSLEQWLQSQHKIADDRERANPGSRRHSKKNSA
ncbi:MAG: hypothetical protein AAF622_20755, partial [Cyanobacteria bacterium P01_C01_bin.147]